MQPFGGGCRVIEKGSVNEVFPFQQCLNVSTILIEPNLALVSGSAYLFCGSSIDSVSKDSQSAPTSFELRPRDLSMLSISAIDDCLKVLLLSLEACIHLGAYIPCGCLGGRILMLSLETINLWSVQWSAPHMAFLTDIMPVSLPHDDIVK